MNESGICPTCDYLTLVLQRPAACERHAPPVERSAAPSFITRRGSVAFTAQELASLKALRTGVRGRLEQGVAPDDLPGAIWRAFEG